MHRRCDHRGEFGEFATAYQLGVVRQLHSGAHVIIIIIIIIVVVGVLSVYLLPFFFFFKGIEMSLGIGLHVCILFMSYTRICIIFMIPHVRRFAVQITSKLALLSRFKAVE